MCQILFYMLPMCDPPQSVEGLVAVHLSHVATKVTEASGSLGTLYGHTADDHWGWKHGHPDLIIHIP